MMKRWRFGGHQSRYISSICPEGEQLASHKAALFDLSVSEMCKYVVFFFVRSCDRKMYELFGFLPLTCIEWSDLKGRKQQNRNYLFSDICGKNDQVIVKVLLFVWQG